MAKLAESRDPETGEHLERMRNYSRILAQHLATRREFAGIVDEEYVRLIYLTSPLHDIGKVGIPDSVLLKPGRLSNREFEIMKQHAAIGAETLQAAARQYPGVAYLGMARDIAVGHHERFDGSGYPTGLAGGGHPAIRADCRPGGCLRRPDLETRVQTGVCPRHRPEHDRGRERQAL